MIMWRYVFVLLLVSLGLWRLAYDHLLFSIEVERMAEEQSFYEERWCWTHPHAFGCRQPGLGFDPPEAGFRDAAPPQESHESTVRTTLAVAAPPAP